MWGVGKKCYRYGGNAGCLQSKERRCVMRLPLTILVQSARASFMRTLFLKLLTFTAVMLCLLGLMAYTNPSLATYEGFVNRLVLEEAKKQKDPLVNAAGLLFGGFASRLIVGQTERKDYVFLSVYDASLGREHVRAVGLFNNFILVEKPEALSGQ